MDRPLRVISSVAPIRICDNGGWTDTWFAGHGRIFNIAVYPYAEVQLEVFARTADESTVTIVAENYGRTYTRNVDKADWDHHPLLEAAIERMRLPRDLNYRVTIFSEAPSGASTGTSASVSVALIAALDQLTPGQLTPHELAYTAQKVETEMLGLQCGIQDQLCAAYGGINFIDMHDYPHASVSQVDISNAVWWELERRLALVYLGKPHSSSEVHKQVIARLEGEGSTSNALTALRRTAEQSRDALYDARFDALGRAMIENTEAQARLHPDLVGEAAREVIEIAKAHGAIGWKVNGAGGDGGSVTLLCGDRSVDKRAMLRQIEQTNDGYRNIPIYLSRRGVRIWEHNPVRTGKIPRVATHDAQESVSS